MTDTPKPVADLAYELINRFEHLTSEQRLDVLGMISDKFCEHCGDHQPPYSRCQCWNDE